MDTVTNRREKAARRNPFPCNALAPPPRPFPLETVRNGPFDLDNRHGARSVACNGTRHQGRRTPAASPAGRLRSLKSEEVGSQAAIHPPGLRRSRRSPSALPGVLYPWQAFAAKTAPPERLQMTGAFLPRMCTPCAHPQAADAKWINAKSPPKTAQLFLIMCTHKPAALHLRKPGSLRRPARPVRPL